MRKVWITGSKRRAITQNRLVDCESAAEGNSAPEALQGRREATVQSNTSAGCLQHFSDGCHSWQTQLLLTKSKQSAFTTYRGDNSSSTFRDTSMHHTEEISQGPLKQMITKWFNTDKHSHFPVPSLLWRRLWHFRSWHPLARQVADGGLAREKNMYRKGPFITIDVFPQWVLN